MSAAATPGQSCPLTVNTNTCPITIEVAVVQLRLELRWNLQMEAASPQIGHDFIHVFPGEFAFAAEFEFDDQDRLAETREKCGWNRVETIFLNQVQVHFLDARAAIHPTRQTAFAHLLLPFAQPGILYSMNSGCVSGFLNPRCDGADSCRRKKRCTCGGGRRSCFIDA